MSCRRSPLDVLIGLAWLWILAPIILFFLKVAFWGSVFVGLYAWFDSCGSGPLGSAGIKIDASVIAVRGPSPRSAPDDAAREDDLLGLEVTRFLRRRELRWVRGRALAIINAPDSRHSSRLIIEHRTPERRLMNDQNGLASARRPRSGGPLTNWKDAFEPSKALDALPDRRLRVCWTVSAASDTRPLVYFSAPWLERVGRMAGIAPIEPPELHVFTCISPNRNRGLEGLGRFSFEDRGVRLQTTRYEALHLDTRRVPFEVDGRYYRLASSFGRQPERAALVDVHIQSRRSDTAFTTQVLYLEVENINAFDVYFSAGVFDVRYLVATREGVGMGGCGKSILTHVYEEDRIATARTTGFEPQYVVTWSDFTHEMFMNTARRRYPNLRTVAPYTCEREDPPSRHRTAHHLNRLWESR